MTDKLNGFVLQSSRPIKEINAIGYHYIHAKTGATLIHLANDDDNKVFSIGFRTPPTDDTGVPHIIEHSVLCGSDKYPVKEPFVELLKGSLNTFLNAMTSADITIYPFASRNEQDYMNIMDIYLDAVFNPSIHSIKQIFEQEGWHYHLEQPTDPLTLNGVVYSEMKGAYSSPERLIDFYADRALYDNCYHYSSGGWPEAIPTLTYQAFCDFHKRYYHPSNSCTFVYGDCDINKITKAMDEQFLSKYSQLDVSYALITDTKPIRKSKVITQTYAIADTDDEEGKTYVLQRWLIKQNDSLLNLGLDILADVLVNTDASPLKQALLKEGLCGNVTCNNNSWLKQPAFTILVSNVKKENKQRVQDIITSTLVELSKGLDKNLIEACLNSTEFKLREGDGGYPKGLEYCLQCIGPWTYGLDMMQPLMYNTLLKKLRSGAKKDYFEKLLDKYLVKNNHNVVILLDPQKGLGASQSKTLEDKLAKYRASLDQSALQQIVDDTNKLLARQNTPDTPEQLETIPLLSLDDIDRKVKYLAIKETEIAGSPLLHHNTFTSGIIYLNMMFKSCCIDSDDLPYLGLLKDLLGKMSTSNRSYEQLSNDILTHTGDIKYSTTTYTDSKDISKTKYFFEVQLKTLASKTPTALEILQDILTATDYTDKQRIKQILNMVFVRSQRYMTAVGHRIAASRLSSYYSQAGYYTEMTNNYGYYDFVKQLIDNFDNRIDGIIVKIKEIAHMLFSRRNLTVNITCKVKELTKYTPYIADMIGNLNSIESQCALKPFVAEKKNEGFLTPSNVQYVATGYNYIDLGHKYNGKLQVLKTILSNDYLWNAVRVKGGAYGCMIDIRRTGAFLLVSYRDPQLKNTLKAYKEIVSYLKSYKISDREMTKYIIGTFQEVDYPLLAERAGTYALTNYLCNISKADMQRARNQIFDIKPSDIAKFAKLVKDVIAQGYICVLGNAEVLKKDAELFGKLI
ncbi:MAG: insulinase family protein [Clostridia bacterium]|nr:insulinase family protein [Clostridia bacterium]